MTRTQSRISSAILLIVLLLAMLAAARADLLDPQNMRDFIVGFGYLAPMAYALIYVIAIFIPYGTTIMTVTAGLAFGTLWGSLLTFCVTIFASLVPMTVARRLGRDWVERRIGRTRARQYADMINNNAFLVFFYLRLIPSLPYEMQNYVAGISRISYTQFMLASALGTGPIIFILGFLGDSLTDPGSPRFWLAALIYLTVLLAPPVYLLIRSQRPSRPSGKR